MTRAFLLDCESSRGGCIVANLNKAKSSGEEVVQKKWHNAPNNWLELAEKNAPMGQLVKPQQLARLVDYILSPNAGVMTGALVEFDENIVGPSD